MIPLLLVLASQLVQGELVLTEISRTAVPDSVTLVSAVLVDSQRVIYVGESRHGTILFDGDSLRSLGQAGKPIGLTIIGPSIQVLDQNLLVHTFVSRQTYTSSKPLEVPLIPDAAVWLRDSWHVGGRNASGGYVVYRALDDGSMERVWGAEVGDNLARRISEGPDGKIALTQMALPFATEQVPSSGAEMDPPQFMPPTKVVASDGRWIPLPLTMVESSFLRVFADLRSDERLFVVYDGSGRIVRERIVQVPIGISGRSLDGGPFLLGVSELGTVQVHVYRWSWST